MSERALDPAGLAALPLFPLPGAVLLPEMVLSLHVFEPRYRQMMAEVIAGHRLVGIAMLDDTRASYPPVPPVHPVVGVGALVRSAKLPDGRYNIVLEGRLRARVLEELPQTARFRRARVEPLADLLPADERQLEQAVSSLRSLSARLIAQVGASEAELLERLNEVEDPGLLADVVAAVTMESPLDRQRVLSEPDVLARIRLASAGLAQHLLNADAKLGQPPAIRWGIGTGKA